MARCNDCNKFVSVEAVNDPEIDCVDVDADGNVTGSVRITATCVDCSSELKEYSFEVEQQEQDVADHMETHGEGHEFELEIETTEEQIAEKTEKRKTYYGANFVFNIKCSCGGFEHTGHWEDFIQSSDMDDL